MLQDHLVKSDFLKLHFIHRGTRATDHVEVKGQLTTDSSPFTMQALNCLSGSLVAEAFTC